MKRVIALGMLAASLIVAPSAAFAGDTQDQRNDQYTEQNGAATDGSINTQDARSENVQRQEIKNRDSRVRRHRGRYGRYDYKRRGRSADQSQDSVQGTVQNGAADYDSDNAQHSDTTNEQEQKAKQVVNYSQLFGSIDTFSGVVIVIDRASNAPTSSSE